MSEGCTARTGAMSAKLTARASPSGGARTKVAAASRARLAADVDVAVMLNGSDLCKIKSRSWKKQRRFQLQDDCLTVQYESRKASKNKCTFSMDDIEAVREGHQSKVLENSSFAPERCFTIVFRGRRNNLDLAAETATEAQHWMSGLGKLVANMGRMGPQERHDTWIYEWFKKADKNKDERMHLKEVKDLLLMMNIQMNEYHAERLFKWADRSCSGTLEYDEFVEFYQALTQREEVRFLFQRLCHDTNNVLSASKLTGFLQDCQGELDAMEERSTYLIKKHEPCEIVREQGCMTFDGFLLYLTSPDGSVFNPIHGSIHQSMKEPLSHYFISSSHNTYLLQDQLRGPSSTEAYIKAFLKGCRCVELDCWDGPNEEPVIYHGYTLTSKILFRDAIQVVEKYAFKVSEYPVILSIENHCSLEQQRVMAHHMKSILKNKLLTEPVQSGESEQPSPEQLKGKVLIKGKKLMRVKQPAVDVGFRAAQNGEVGEVSDEDEAAEMEDEDVRCKVKSHGKERHQNLARELSDCIVYCRSVHFPGLSSPRHPWETSSLSEGKANKLLKEGGRELVCHNRQFLMRVYPAARRTDSSNFDPMPYWSAGYQIVALNFQTPGDEMDLYEGWFKQNGSCGLVLKPMCLRSPTSRFSPTEPQPGYGLHPVRLKIKVISGQQLPKVANSSKGSIVDPLVRVEIHGVPSDNARLETKYIDNNGFSPQWNESLSFVLTVPELALVRFVVEDHDTASRNDFVAQYTLPFSSLCRGYRHVHLLSQDGTSVAPSSLFVYIHITDLE